jgi:hypothetical protein
METELLELKHIKNYLDHRLLISTGVNDKLLEMVYAHTEVTHSVIEENQAGPISIEFLLSKQFKPLLHPLSSLTKPIEHKGETFVPARMLDEVFGFYYRTPITLEYFIQDHLSTIPHGVIDKLFEWHFDVFGLIEKGLALDKSTLKH